MSYDKKIVDFLVYKKRKQQMSITTNRKKEIEEQVNKILQGEKFKKNPQVDIVALVEKENFVVKAERMEINTTGLLYAGDDERVITVNKEFKNPDNEENVVFKKSRFITAHEYGHFILHKEQLGTPIYAHRDTYNRTSTIELEADYFARSILMPLEKFRLFHEAAKQMCNEEDYEEFVPYALSVVFGVTRNKVLKRMEDLSELN